MLYLPEYTGKGDPTVWLDSVNLDDHPHLVPLWPDDYPAHLAVFLTPDGRLGVGTTWQDMMQAKGPDRLWFCKVPRDSFIAETSAESSWFQGSN